jgi:L-ascorbate metabolism protein UlaG (beta-lactamase superfamily)
MPTSPVDPKTFATAPASGLRVTWLGHSTTLVEIDGHRVLTDPVWSERVSPVDGVGPSRWVSPLVPLAELPRIDAVVVSHDHYDHCDYATLAAMKAWDTKFIVPLGVGAHLAYWGIPESRIVELDWWESTPIGDLSIVATPARHASGRTVFDKDATLWAGYAFVGSKHRVYFSGDTGLFPAMNEIGSKLGPFDLTMIETGQYHPTWPDWHLGPEQAVMAHRMVRGRLMLPIHWGLLELAYHGWTEPVERTLAAAERSGSTVVTPRPGQSFEPDAPPAPEHWWPAIPWETGEQKPVVSTGIPAAALPR